MTGMKGDPETALTRYLAMGPNRSLRRLAVELGAIGIAVHEDTVRRWSARYGWQAQARAFEARRDEEEAQRVTSLARGLGDADDMHERHAALGRELVRLADEWARKLVAEGHPVTPTDVARWAEAGVRIERLAMGEATSRTEVHRTTYNTLLVGVLELFKAVVQPAIPGDEREMVSREFADGVNAITGKVLEGDGKTAASRAAEAGSSIVYDETLSA